MGTCNSTDTPKSPCANSPTPTISYRINLLGSEGIGKTSLITRWADDSFQEDPRQFMAKKKEFLLDGQKIIVSMRDSGAETERTDEHPSSYYHVNGMLLVFDVTSPQTLENLKSCYKQLCRRRTQDQTVVLLVGNKCDLEPTVTTEEAQEWANKHADGCTYIETSAKDNTNVDQAFMELIRQILRSEAGDLDPSTFELI